MQARKSILKLFIAYMFNYQIYIITNIFYV